MKIKKTNNSYSGFSYPKELFKVFTNMKVGDAVKRDDLIETIWNQKPDWFLRRSFDAARSNAVKGTEIKLQCRKGIITKLS